MWSRGDSGRRQSSSAKVSDQEVPPLMWIQRIEQVYWCLEMNVPVLSGKSPDSEVRKAAVKAWRSGNGVTTTCDGLLTGVCVCTWIEQDDGSKAAQLCFVHLHVPHLAYKFCQNSAERWTRQNTRQKLESRTEAGKMQDDKESKEVKKENLKTTKGGKDRVRTHISGSSQSGDFIFQRPKARQSCSSSWSLLWWCYWLQVRLALSIR